MLTTDDGVFGFDAFLRDSDKFFETLALCGDDASRRTFTSAAESDAYLRECDEFFRHFETKDDWPATSPFDDPFSGTHRPHATPSDVISFASLATVPPSDVCLSKPCIPDAAPPAPSDSVERLPASPTSVAAVAEFADPPHCESPTGTHQPPETPSASGLTNATNPAEKKVLSSVKIPAKALVTEKRSTRSRA